MRALGSIDISSTLHSKWNTTDYQKIARFILGPKYNLSIVLIADTKAHTLNKKHRKKDYATNVLTFPLDDTHAEIFLTIPKIRREAATFGLTPQGHAKFLLIHGCLHLIGYSHGSTMEGAENKLVAKFNIR